MNAHTQVKSGSLMDRGIWDGKIFVGGWRPGRGGAAEVTDKATGETIAQVGLAAPGEVDQACAAALRAAPAWARTPAEDRAAIVRRAGELLVEHMDEAVYWLVRESGSTRYKAHREAMATSRHFVNSADYATRPSRTVVADTEELLSYYERVPLGVVGVIGPFNFALILGLRSVSAAIATGNTVVLKPSLNTAVCGGFLIARLFEAAGLPQDVLHVVPGEGPTGDALVRNADVRMLAFTGSTGVGRQIGARAGEGLKRTALELGGKNPFVVLEDADLELAARAGAFGGFLHQGQICMSIGLHIVHESLVDAYAARVGDLAREMKVGDPWTEQVAMRPLINEKQRDHVDAIVKDTLRAGAQLVEGGVYRGLFYRPTVLKNVPHASRAFKEEVFGPVAVVVSFKTDEEALQMANGTGFGLAAGVFGEPDHARRVAAEITNGMVHVNDHTVVEDARAPFGGNHQSGNPTRVGGPADLEEYTTYRWTTENRKPQPYTLPVQ